MKYIKYVLLTCGIMLGFGTVMLPATVYAAADPILEITCKGPIADQPEICKHKDENILTSVRTIVNTLLYILGAIAVIVIVIAGIRFVVSGGNEVSVKAARSTILYAAVGLIVAILAFAIVNFVIDTLK